MLFNTIDFAVFLPVVFGIYWLLPSTNVNYRNVWLLSASYFFYGWWDWRFLILIALSTLIDYSVGLGLKVVDYNDRYKRLLLAFSLVTNLGMLGFFKYANFFIENFNKGFTLLGTSFNQSSIDIILPLGISFYTFQTLSYSIDIYKGKLEPTKSLINFAAFISFFPQLVAGPIERAKNLLPQFDRMHIFHYQLAVDGMRQILWGLVKKVVIADSCAEIVNQIYDAPGYFSGSTLLFGTIFFAFQIYGDFSGYSDIALGTARLFGFKLQKNFAFPYFSRDIAEFWRRWHISLSTWFKDYLYFPLGGSRGTKLTTVRNIFIIFLVSGFWHGANWTFLAWGGLHSLYYLPLILTNSTRKNIDLAASHNKLPSLPEFSKILFTFLLVSLAWVFFRSENFSQAILILNKIFSESLLQLPDFPLRRRAFYITLIILGFLAIEWTGRKSEYAIENYGLSFPKVIRWIFYLILALLILFFNGQENEFIYFQF